MTDLNVPADVRDAARRAMDIAASKVEHLVTQHPDYLPLFTKNGKWRHDDEPWTNWCEGFPPGMMWIFERQVDPATWRPRAIHYSTLLRGRENDQDVHDLGFTFWSSWRPWFLSTGDLDVHDFGQQTDDLITWAQSTGARLAEARRPARIAR